VGRPLELWVWHITRMKRLVVVVLNRLCLLLDDFVYRPAIVRVGLPLPRWWNCELAKLSIKLDDAWGVGYWNDETGPAVPGSPCEACGRRAAIFVVGGPLEEDGDEDDIYLARRPVHLCGWCSLEPAAPIDSEEDLTKELTLARERSVSWKWRWPAKG
jgi:hypothetical protein